MSPGLKFHLEESDGEPIAVFADGSQLERMLLPRFLHHAPHFVADMLYEISLVERKAVESSGFETALVDVQFFPDKVMITSKFMEVEESVPEQVVLSIDEAKLLLLQWGMEMLLWKMRIELG